MIEQEAEDAPPAADLETLTEEAKKAEDSASDKIVEIDVMPIKADAAPEKAEPEPKQPEAAKAEKPAETKKESAPAEPAPAKKSGDEEERAEAEVVPFSRPPDDPGVEPEEEEAPKSRFRLF